MLILHVNFLRFMQGRHGLQGPQGLGLVWILQNRKRWRQQWHVADMAATVKALPAKNWPWRPWSIESRIAPSERI